MNLINKQLNQPCFKTCYTTPDPTIWGNTDFIFLPLSWEEFDFRNNIFVLNSNINKPKINSYHD